MGVVWAVALTCLVCLLMALVVLDRIGFAVSGRSRLPWRRNTRTQAVLATGLDEVTALFYATKHCELEQRKTELVLREVSDDGAPGRFGLDLDGGRPVITVDTSATDRHTR